MHAGGRRLLVLVRVNVINDEESGALTLLGKSLNGN